MAYILDMERPKIYDKQRGFLMAFRSGLLVVFISCVGVTTCHLRAEGPVDSWWSLKPIVKPRIPRVDHRFRAWPVNAIDHFVLRGLLAKGMEPAPAAEPGALIRRVYFDLTGLPPTPEELEAFVREPSSQNFQKVVDRLLGSPRYGERWARHWMDVVHFAESHGHDQDVPRKNAWPYRDYLIQSFNADKPYGHFVEEQIAADVVFPKEPAAIAALGFLAAGPWDESSLRDIRADTLDRKAAQYLDRDDMIGTVTNALLSTTVQCARCHDHKFDPISQDEYYGLQAVFAGVDRADRPFDADSRVHEKRLQLTKRRNELKAGVQAAIPYIDDPAISAWEKSRAARLPPGSCLTPMFSPRPKARPRSN